MADVSLTDEQVRAYFATVFPMPASADDATPEYWERLAKWTDHQTRMLGLFETGIGHDMPGVTGTAWAAYNAVTEWTDHHYPVLQSGDVSMPLTQSVLFGAYADAKRRAFAEAMALAS